MQTPSDIIDLSYNYIVVIFAIMIYSFYILNKTANARIFYHDCVKLQEEKMLKFHFFCVFFAASILYI
jgi:hypothetical protein